MLQAYHKSEGKEVALKDEKLIMNSILAAMKWAKMDFAKEELEAMFSSQGEFKKRGSKSAKMLRHGSMHEHNEYDIQEILDRFAELDARMDDFLDRIRRAEEKTTQTKTAGKKTAKKANKKAITL